MTSTPAHPSSYPYRPRRPSRPPINPWLVRLPVLFFSGGILLVVVLLIFLAAFQLRYMEKIVPGVSALGLDLSGMTQEEAAAVLSTRFTYDDEAIFTLRYGDQVWQMTAGELGVSFDAEATAEEAFIAGHSGNVFTDLGAQAFSWFNGRSIAPVVKYDQNIARQRLLDIASTINRPAIDASLVISGTQVITTEAQTGRTLDIPATLALLDNAIMNMTSGQEITLVINETPPTIWDVQQAAQRARIALSGPVTLVATDANGQPLGPWTATVEQIAALLQVELVDNGDGTRSYAVNIDMSAFESFLNELAPGLIIPPRDGRFQFNEATGQLEPIVPAITGRELNVEATLERLEASVFNAGNRTVAMAFNLIEPMYHNNITAAELGITQLVAEATTYFAGSSSERRHNIAVGASRINGVIIPPGEEFSFNTVLGDISYENGFVDGKVIFGGRTVDGIGGGICQVSTTAFRAAFFGGYAIIERNSHGYRVGYYEQGGHPPGLDAAIWQPQRDFRFQNDTPYHLLIEAEVFPSQNALQFRFYSTNPGRRVEIETPIIRDIVPALPTIYEANAALQPGQSLQVDYAAEGADVTIYRNIYDLEGNLIRRDYIYTHYLPWAAIIQVAPGDARLQQNTGGA